MTIRELLIDGFEYDLWATELWIATLKATPNDEMWTVLSHIAWSQETWMQRCTGVDPHTPELVEDRLRHMGQAWIDLLKVGDLDAVLNFKHPELGEVSRSLTQIARHVVDHGSYHRGQIREIAGRNGIGWPETGMARYFSAQDRNQVDSAYAQPIH